VSAGSRKVREGGESWAHWENAKPRFLRILCTARTFLMACREGRRCEGQLLLERASASRGVRGGTTPTHLLELLHPRSVVGQVVLLDLLDDVVRLGLE